MAIAAKLMAFSQGFAVEDFWKVSRKEGQVDWSMPYSERAGA